MKRTLVVVAAVVGFAAAASAGTLTVFTTDVANNPTNTFAVGDTILLKVTGDGQGQTSETSIVGQLQWDGSLTTTNSASQFQWQTDLGFLAIGDGFGTTFNQTGPNLNAGVGTSVLNLTADAIGTTGVTWGDIALDFFGIYSYNSEGISIDTGHSFTIVAGGVVPEPTTAGLVGLGLLGLVLSGRRRA